MNSSRRPWLVFAALAAVVAAAALYQYFGGSAEPPVAVAPKPGTESPPAAAPGAAKSLKALSDEQLERMVAQSLLQTQTEPNNASAWAMLAHSYEMLGKFAESAKTYAKLAEILPKDAQVLADYADVLAVANGRSFKGEPFGLIKRALAVDPKNAKALLLAGSAYIEGQDHVQALAYLERARSASTDPAFLRQVDETIAQAKALSGASSAATAAPVQAKADPGAAGGANAAQVSGRVWLAEDLRDKAPPQATVFVYARPVDGSRMPVALLRNKGQRPAAQLHLG